MPTVHNNNNFSLEGNTQSPAETWKTSQWVWWAYAHDFDEFSKTKKEFEFSLTDFCECFNVFTHRSMERSSLQSRNKYAVVFQSAMGQLYCA